MRAFSLECGDVDAAGYQNKRASLVAQPIKNLPAVQTWV